MIIAKPEERRVGRTGTTRRHALMAAGATTAGLLTGCTQDSPAEDSPAGIARAAEAERALRVRAAGTSRELLRQYDAVLTRHPGQRERLAPLRAAVVRQLAALAPEPSESASPAASPSTAPSVSVTAAAPAPGSPAVPAEPAAALRALAATERRTSDAHTATLMEAPPELARLLASLAAASAAHAYLLTEGSRS
ncbi:hypothetical protein ACIRQP_38260 [Streptomyces sp. NPDC102274]|uniref:hypothetical protein n=1 Tax=Streptomyces sp. NPDC102274 TaxID=3366151 RepID=UPI00381D0605